MDTPSTSIPEPIPFDNPQTPPANGVKRKSKSRTRANVRKWTQTVLDAGFTWVPNALLEKQRVLGLDPVDVNILLQFAAHWWKKEHPPFLHKRTIAQRINRHPTTVRRRIAKLEDRGFLKRVMRFGPNNNPLANAYSLEPLVEKLHQAAIDLRNEREAKRKAREARDL